MQATAFFSPLEQISLRQRTAAAGAAALIVFAGILHVLIAPQHLGHAGHAIFLVVAGSAQIAWGVAFWRRPSAAMHSLGVVLAGAFILLWAMTRVVPAPFGHGPGDVEAVGVATKVLEGVGLTGLMAMVLLGARSHVNRWPAWKMVLAPMTLAVAAAFLLYGVGLAAERTFPWLGGDAHSDAGQHSHSYAEPEDHHEAHQASADAPAHYLTVNVDISDAGIQPSSIFIPAGQRVQLVLRNRGSSEHHFRVAGLAPGHLLWASEAEGVGEEGVSDEDHEHHHATDFVPWRATSPSGIRPTGDEVHAYVSPSMGMDVVLFTATEPGTYVVHCPLHPEVAGKVTVFASPGQAPVPAPALEAEALTRALTRDIGVLGYAAGTGVQVEATYATPEYVSVVLGDALAARLQPERYAVILVTERLHTANLPVTEVPPDLRVDGDLMPLAGKRLLTDSPHHRITAYQFIPDSSFGQGHQVMTLTVASAGQAIWHLPVAAPAALSASGTILGLSGQWGLVLALMAGMVAAMWPCLFQLTAFFIPALAGVSMQEATGGVTFGGRVRVLKAALFFILGFTLVFTMAGALIGLGAQRLGDTSGFEVWQRWIGAAAGVVIIALALRTAARVRAPLVCKMPVFSRLASRPGGARPHEMMAAGLAFATGCMTCFGAALVVGMVVYVGLAQSPLYGAFVLFLFSLGMGIPLVIAAVAMAKALPVLFKLEKVVPWMGLASAVIMVGFGVLLISGNYMVVSEWVFRLASSPGSSSADLSTFMAFGVVAALAVALGWLTWLGTKGRDKKAGKDKREQHAPAAGRVP